MPVATLDPRLIDPVPRGVEDVRAFELAEGLWSLSLPLAYPKTRAVNCFLLRTADGWTLVDCGSYVGPGWRSLEQGLRLAGVEPRAITRLLLTHLHPDHASLAPRVLLETGAELVHLDAPRTQWDALREISIPAPERRRRALQEGVPRAHLEDVVSLALVGDGFAPAPPADALVRPGDVLRTSAGDWTVHAAPGHSPNMLVLHDEAGGRLLSADSAYPGIRPFLEWGHTPDAYGDYERTLDLVESLRPRLVIPSHGGPAADVATRVPSARAAVREAADGFRRALGDGPASAYDVACAVPGVGDSPDPDWRQSSTAFALCVLEHDELAGRVTSAIHDDGVRRFARKEPA